MCVSFINVESLNNFMDSLLNISIICASEVYIAYIKGYQPLRIAS